MAAKPITVGLRLRSGAPLFQGGSSYTPDGDGPWDTQQGELHLFTLHRTEDPIQGNIGFEVRSPDGTAIGRVFKRSFTRENRTPGRTYVNKRWESPPRWTYNLTGDYGRDIECDSRKDAVARLANAHLARMEVKP